MGRAAAAAVAVVAVALGAGLALSAGGRAGITVYAAASLTDVFPAVEHETYSFGSSKSLAVQIEQGAPADVFAAADTSLPDELHAKGQCSKPVVFTRNRLVVVVPTANPGHVHTIRDLTQRGVRVDIAAAGVPVGDYTRQVLGNLGLTGKVMANVVSQETDVRGVLSKVALGEADAGFVYATDAKTVQARVRVVQIPARAQPTVRYGICVVTASAHKTDAQAFIKLVLGPAGQKTLLRYGFLPQ